MNHILTSLNLQTLFDLLLYQTNMAEVQGSLIQFIYFLFRQLCQYVAEFSDVILYINFFNPALHAY